MNGKNFHQCKIEQAKEMENKEREREKAKGRKHMVAQ